MTDQYKSDTERFKLPHEKILEAAEKKAERREKERIHCPECDTTVWKDSIEDALETAESHDEKRHNGERTAKVNGFLPPSDEVVKAADEAIERINPSTTDTDQ